MTERSLREGMGIFEEGLELTEVGENAKNYRE